MATVHWQYGDGALAIWRRCTGNMATLAYLRRRKKLGVVRVCGHFENDSQTLYNVGIVGIVAQGAAPLPFGRAAPAALRSYGGYGVTGDSGAAAIP